ncbi:hypothetical protein [Tannerella forsythia]|uniref:hypothetical protein n=1 Tax=Tannerella forsythia TaxID=28112 RepID=UPI0028E32ACA|nr:hypothetical protein [Tannerella forsythia]
MKRIQSILLAIAMPLATPAFFTSCQEDAPDIHYTLSVSVINDFTKVVEEINKGKLDHEEAIRKLTSAIDKMNADQQTKLQAIIDVLTSVNATLETKFAAIEAVIKAQTLSLEAKLALIETAIKALPDYSLQLAAIETAIKNLPDYGDKLAAIEAAVKAMPDYGDKFDAVVAALNAMKAQIEALGTGQAGIVTAINNTTAAINSLIAAVNSGNTSAAAALAQIIQKLEELKDKIGGGGGSTEEYVDLGLPSGIKWAKRNLGASKPSDYGNYYAWGETEPKADYTWATYKWMQAGQSDWKHITKYTIADGQTEGIWYDAGGTFIGDNKTTLEAADDAATRKLGSPWRMPTLVEIRELLDANNCTWTWTTQDGKNGYEVKSKTNGNSIFLPAAGYRGGSELYVAGRGGFYWSSSLGAADSDGARGLGFDSGGHDWYYGSRYYGFSVRPVRP